MTKPLFIPLMAQYYDDFMLGRKKKEYRINGPRWNTKTCYPERQVILSRGYGKQNRAHTVIKEVTIVDLMDFEASFQERLRGILKPKKLNPEIIIITMGKIISPVLMAIDPAHGDDNAVQATYSRQEDGSIFIRDIRKVKS